MSLVAKWIKVMISSFTLSSSMKMDLVVGSKKKETNSENKQFLFNGRENYWHQAWIKTTDWPHQSWLFSSMHQNFLLGWLSVWNLRCHSSDDGESRESAFSMFIKRLCEFKTKQNNKLCWQNRLFYFPLSGKSFQPHLQCSCENHLLHHHHHPHPHPPYGDIFRRVSVVSAVLMSSSGVQAATTSAEKPGGIGLTENPHHIMRLIQLLHSAWE